MEDNEIYTIVVVYVGKSERARWGRTSRQKRSFVCEIDGKKKKNDSRKRMNWIILGRLERIM